MINEKNKILTGSWWHGLLSAEIFISTGEWGVQMPTLTDQNSQFLRSEPQEVSLVMEANSPAPKYLNAWESRLSILRLPTVTGQRTSATAISTHQQYSFANSTMLIFQGCWWRLTVYTCSQLERRQISTSDHAHSHLVWWEHCDCCW